MHFELSGKSFNGENPDPLEKAFSLFDKIRFKDRMDLFVTNWEGSLDHHPKHGLVRDPAYQWHLLPGGGERDGEGVLV